MVAEITADDELKASLVGNIFAGTAKALPIYKTGEKPTKLPVKDYIEIQYNGAIKSSTVPIGYFSGNLMATLFCPLGEDEAIRYTRVNKIISQMEDAINLSSSSKYSFLLNIKTPITPTTANVYSGYSITVLNVSWHSK